MSRPLYSSLFASALLAVCTCVQAGNAPPKVLLVVSGEGRTDASRPGFDLEEFAKTWAVLRAAGLAVETASPQGGLVHPDKHNPKAVALAALNADARAQLAATRSTAAVASGEHAAIVVVGGKGAMFDLPRDAALARLLSQHHARGGVVAAFCHGPAALTAASAADGRPLLAGRRMTGFTDEEEAVFGKRWAAQYPFMLEARAREQGARWEEGPLLAPTVVQDGALITGQGPFAAVGVAQAVVRALGHTPAAHQPWPDDAALVAVERWRGGDEAPVHAALAGDAKAVNIDFIGLAAGLQFEAAHDAGERRRLLALMERVAPRVDHPQMGEMLAGARAKMKPRP